MLVDPNAVLVVAQTTTPSDLNSPSYFGVWECVLWAITLGPILFSIVAILMASGQKRTVRYLEERLEGMERELRQLLGGGQGSSGQG